jgi:hypothetical protein
LWSNPFLVRQQTWQWLDNNRQVVVGLECAAPAGLLRLPDLQTVGQAVLLLVNLERLNRLPASLAVRQAAYHRDVWGPLLLHYPPYADRQLAVSHVRLLLSWIPAPWLSAATAVYNAALLAGHPPPVCTDASMQLARQQLSTHLGWLFGTHKLLLAELTVAAATKLQSLQSVVEISQRHQQCLQRVRMLDHLPANAPLPVVSDVLKRWWGIRVANNYKEAAWKLPLNAFPTAARMQLHGSHCVACGVLAPDVSHHFWSCPVAVAVRHEIEKQLVAFTILPAGANLASAHIWLGCKPSQSRLHTLIWDMVCIAAVHAMDRGRATAWAVAASLATPVLVNQVAERAAVGAFWSALADFAATSYVPRSARTVLLTQQPFLAWHVVLSQGNGLRLVRH